MTTLREAADRYLTVRRNLGYKLKIEGRMLGQFVAFCDARDLDHVTVNAAVEWATAPAGADVSWWAARLSVIRGFARFQAVFDARTEVPATDLLPRRGSEPAVSVFIGRDHRDAAGGTEPGEPAASRHHRGVHRP